MMRTCSLFLIVTIGMSIALFPMVEAGHQLLHSFKNGLHHHATAHHYHTIADHKVKQSVPSADANEEASGQNFISLLFGLSVPLQVTLNDIRQAAPGHATMFVCVYLSISLCPPTPPPLG